MKNLIVIVSTMAQISFFGCASALRPSGSRAPAAFQGKLMPSGTNEDLVSIHGSGDEIWAVGPGVSLRWNGSVWQPGGVPEFSQTVEEPKASCQDKSFKGLWVSGKDDVWVGCTAESDGDGVAHWNGKAWHYFALHANRAVNSIWASGPNNVWAVEGNYVGSDVGKEVTVSGYLGHFTGTKWQKVGLDLSANGLWRTDDGSLWSLCNNFSVCRDNEPKLLNGPTSADDDDPEFEWLNLGESTSQAGNIHFQGDGKTALYGIWASGPKDVWVVGDHSTILHFDGSSWVKINQKGDTVDLRGIYGTKKNGTLSIWAVGEAGAILHFDGQHWNKIEGNTSVNLHSVWANDAGMAWAVGDKGTILQMNN